MPLRHDVVSDVRVERHLEQVQHRLKAGEVVEFRVSRPAGKAVHVVAFLP